MAKQGFNLVGGNPYVYQESDGGGSSAVGWNNSSQLFEIKTQATAGATPTGTPQFKIDPAAAGNITITPNGAGNLIVSSLGLGAVLSSSTGQLSSTGAGTSGQVLTSNGAGVAPSFQFIGGGLGWSRETGGSVSLVADHGYVQANSGAGLTTFTLPATSGLGTIITILGESSGGWTIAQNAGQNIQFGNDSTTPGVTGAVSSTNRYDTISIICRVADTTWTVISAVGYLTIS